MMTNSRAAGHMTAAPPRTFSVFWLLTAIFLAAICLPLPGPDGRIAGMPSICPFYELTGLPCPGCGLTRAFVCLGHGQLRASLHWHPLGWLVFGALLALWARAGLSHVLHRPILPLTPTQTSRLSTGGIALLVVTGVVRVGWFLAHPWLRLP